jgi:hypothetical protein
MNCHQLIHCDSVLLILFSLCNNRDEFRRLIQINKRTYKFAQDYRLFQIWKCNKNLYIGPIFRDLCNNEDVKTLNVLIDIYELNITIIGTRRFREVLMKSRLIILKWIYDHFKTIFNLVSLKVFFNYAKKGYFEELKWINSKFVKFFSKYPEIYKVAFLKAAQNGHIEPCKWLNENCILNSNSLTNDEICTIFKNTVPNGHVSICKWLYQTFELVPSNKYFMENCDINNLVIATILNQHLEMCKWLYHTFDKNIFFPVNQSFYLALVKNNFEISKWLFQNFEITNIYYDEGIFFSIIRNGCLDFCKWYYSIIITFDSSYKDKIVFDLIYKNTYKHVIPNIIKNGHTDKYKWLNETFELERFLTL